MQRQKELFFSLAGQCGIYDLYGALLRHDKSSSIVLDNDALKFLYEHIAEIVKYGTINKCLDCTQGRCP